MSRIIHGKRADLKRLAAVLVATGVAGSGLVTATTVPALAAPTGTLTGFGFAATSYGSQTTGNANARSNPTAPSAIGCTGYVPRSDSNFASRTGDGNDVRMTNVSTRNDTTRNNGKTSAVSVVHSSSGTFGGGQVSFRNLTGRVTSYHSATGYHLETVSSIGSLVVAGTPIPLPAGGREQSIPVPGQGTLTINHKVRHASSLSASGSVVVMRLVRPDGTKETVGHAFSRIDGHITGGLFHGAAWGSDSHASNLNATGRTALQPMPCPGTRGNVKSSSTGASNTSSGFFGVQRSYAYGSQRAGGVATGYTRSHIDSARFGGGVLAFRNVKARANVTRRPGSLTRDAKGTGIGKILVNGQEIQQPAAGQARKVAGVGEFMVKTVRRIRSGISVTGVIVTLYNGTPNNTSDDTVVDLARAKLQITKG